MGQITSLFAWKMVRQAHVGLGREELLRSVGIDPEEPIDPSCMILDTDYYDLIERIARSDPCGTELPLRAGASMVCDDYGAFGLAWKSALSLEGSYRRAERYARILTSVAAYTVEHTETGAYMHLHRQGERRLGLRLSNEATIASINAISRQVSSRPFRPLAVYFKHSAPASIAAHESHFGCPVHFSSGKDALAVSADALQTPNRLGDESISKFFDTHLETELGKLQDDVSLDKRVRIQISRLLSEGVPSISEIGGRLGMSGRTLQRRLSDKGLSFQTLVDEARRQLAERLLEQSQYSLAEVSFLTGFSEQSAFTRAFKRWSGQTPRSFRLEVRSRDP